MGAIRQIVYKNKFGILDGIRLLNGWDIRLSEYMMVLAIKRPAIRLIVYKTVSVGYYYSDIRLIGYKTVREKR